MQTNWIVSVVKVCQTKQRNVTYKNFPNIVETVLRCKWIVSIVKACHERKLRNVSYKNFPNIGNTVLRCKKNFSFQSSIKIKGITSELIRAVP